MEQLPALRIVLRYAANSKPLAERELAPRAVPAQKGQSFLDERQRSFYAIVAAITHEKTLDREGQAFELDVDGLLAVCIQHEIDHLDGKLFVDYLSQLKRQRIRKKLEKQRRLGIEDSDADRSHAERVI